MSRHFDAVVVGGGLSASIVAALLAKRQIRGLLIDQDDATDSEGVFPDLLLSQGASRAMRLVHTELGLQEDLRVRSCQLDPSLQVVFPHARLEISQNRDQLVEEIDRVFPGEGESFRAFLTRLDACEDQTGAFIDQAGVLPPRSFLERRRLTHALRRTEDAMGSPLDDSTLLEGLSPSVEAMLLEVLPFLTYLDGHAQEQPTVIRFARAIGRFFRGFSRVEGGLRPLFLDFARRRGFEVRNGQIETMQARGKAVSVQLSGHRDPVTANALVDASSTLSGLEGAPAKGRGRRLQTARSKSQLFGHLYGLCIEVDRSVIPAGMGPHVLLLNGRREPKAADPSRMAPDAPVWLTMRDAATDGRVELSAYSPVGNGGAGPKEKDAVERSITARMERLIPFLEEGRKKRIRALSQARAHPIFALQVDSVLGLTGVPNRTPVKNVFVAGPAVVPGLGIEGEYISALQAVDACLGLKGPGRPSPVLSTRPV